jgi:chromosome segregation ATPase
MTEIKVQEFERLQQDVVRLKQENHQLREQISKLSTVSPTFRFHFFPGTERAEIEKLQHEEAELKKSLQVHQEKNEALREQCQTANISVPIELQIANLDSLFKTRKRELTRMKELNTHALTDLEDQVTIARELCESLESGRDSLSRDKEVVESTTLSLRAARQSLEARIQELERVNQQLRADLGVKTADSSESMDLAFQLRDATDRLASLTAEYAEMNARYDAEEALLGKKEEQRRHECELLDQKHQEQAAQIEGELRSLRKELQGLKSRSPADETVEIDVDTLIQENADLRAKIQALERTAAEMATVVHDNQVDCLFLGNWLKKAPQKADDAEKVLEELTQRERSAREELRRLEEGLA